MNLYAYVGNDPVNATDPSGMDCDESGCDMETITVIDTRPDTEGVVGGGTFWTFTGGGASGGTPEIKITGKRPMPTPKLMPFTSIAGLSTGQSGGTGNSPCDSAGNAPPPSRYSSLGKIVQGMAKAHDPYGMGSAAAAIFDATNLLGFGRGGPLDAQAYGGSPAYANYVYGVYNSAADTSLSGSLGLANTYGNLFSNYPGSVVMDKKYPSIPQVNVKNITSGYIDQTNGSTCHN
jgi:hypothetical protein